jgi:hypothetical protein
VSGPKYRLNPGAFRRNLLQADFMVAEMLRRAERVKAAAEASAPVSSGKYKTSFRVRVKKRGGIHADRAEGIVSSSDKGALAIEFGHFTRPSQGAEAAVPFRRGGTFVDGHYTLTRALDAAGD